VRQPLAYLGERLSRVVWRSKLQGLLLVALVLAAAFFYESTPIDGIIWCPFRRFTGMDCGGCGMTRSWCAIADGDLSLAVLMNPFGPLLFSLAVVKLGFLAVEVKSRRELVIPIWSRVRSWAIGGLVAVMFGFTLYRVWIALH